MSSTVEIEGLVNKVLGADEPVFSALGTLLQCIDA